MRAEEVVATIGDERLAASLDGILRGLTHDGVAVDAGRGARGQRIAEGVLRAIEAGRARIP